MQDGQRRTPGRPGGAWFGRPEDAIALGRSVAGFIGAMLIAWALAAGTWRALLTVAEDARFRPFVADDALRAALLGTGFYTLGALGAAALILLAAGVIGGAFGFLFGLPRMVPGTVSVTPTPRPPPPADATAAGAAAAAAGAAVAPGAAADTAARPAPVAPEIIAPETTAPAPPPRDGATRTGFRPSPALNEIADWLTKIIVGLGLVQARDIGDGFLAVMRFILDDAGMQRFPAAGVVVPACMIAGLIGGFITVYLITALIMGRALAAAAEDLETITEQKLREEAHAAELAKARAVAEAEAAVAQARAERTRATAEQERAEAERERRKVRDAQERAAVIAQWSVLDPSALLGPQPGLRLPAVTGAALRFAEQPFEACATLEEQKAWANLNLVLAQTDPSRAERAVMALSQLGNE
jgi:hypothetical protein